MSLLPTMKPAAYMISPRASASGLPASIVIMRARSSMLSCIKVPILAIIFERSFAVYFFHFIQLSQLIVSHCAVSLAVIRGSIATVSPGKQIRLVNYGILLYHKYQ